MPKMKAPPNPFKLWGQSNPDVSDLDLSGALGVAALPPRIAKEAGKLLVEGINNPTVRRIMARLRELYPRTVGHVDTVQVGKIAETPTASGARTGRAWPPYSAIEEATSPTQAINNWIKQGSIAVNPKNSSDTADTLGHELIHTAQALKDVQFGPKYDLMDRIVGYDLNPFEVRARTGGAKFSAELKEADRLGTTPKQMRQGRADEGAFRKKANSGTLPGSMSEFSPVGAGAPPDLSLAELIKQLQLLGKIK